MNYKFSFCLVVLLYGTVSLAEKARYDNYKLVNLKPQTPLHVHLIDQWEENYDFDAWTRIKTTEESVNVFLSPEAYFKYKILFTIFKIPFEILEDNMQRNIDEQERSMALSRNSRNIAGRYARYAEIQSYIDNLVAANPSLVSSSVAGRTYEGRNLKVAIIKGTGTRKVWIDCGIHAREWVSPATCVWIIDKLVTGYNSGDATARGLLAKFEFHILPSVNPDGYEYSHTTVRMWRKNRRPNSGSSCVGTDLNRNFGFKWLTGGSSTDPCSDTYAGPSADSELETKAIEAYINRYPGQWASYLTIHSYGKWWFTPYGYTGSILPPDYTDLNAKAQIGIGGIRANGDGTGWISGSSAKILYVASGGSEDWAYGTANIKYSYCLELRPGQTGTDANYGFALPEDRAPKAGQETYGGIAAFLNSI